MSNLIVVPVADLVGVYEVVDVVETAKLKIKNKLRGMKFRAKNKARNITFRTFVFLKNNPVLIAMLTALLSALIGYVVGELTGKLILAALTFYFQY